MKVVLFLALILNVSITTANDLVPVIPDASVIDKAVSPVKGGCDQCETASKSGNSSPFYGGPVPKAMVEQVQSIKSTVACDKGKKRLKNDVSFFTTSTPGNSSTLKGNFQSGFMSNGTISDLYVGVSAFKDLMFVTKVKNGDKIVGYNVTLSYCELPNAYKDMAAIISDTRPIDNFSAPYGINLSEKGSSCGHGSVVSISSMVISRRDGTDTHSGPDAQVPTSFVELCRAM